MDDFCLWILMGMHFPGDSHNVTSHHFLFAVCDTNGIWCHRGLPELWGHYLRWLHQHTSVLHILDISCLLGVIRVEPCAICWDCCDCFRFPAILHRNCSYSSWLWPLLSFWPQGKHLFHFIMINGIASKFIPPHDQSFVFFSPRYIQMKNQMSSLREML